MMKRYRYPVTIEQGGNDRIFNSVKLKYFNGRNSESHPSSLEDGRVVTDEDKVNDQVLFGGKATVRIEGDYLL